MTTYLTLFKHTTEAKENIEDAEEWLETGMELSAEVGAEVTDIYFGNIGEYDALVISEGHDETDSERIRLAFERMGTHELEVYPIYEPGEYMELIADLPATA